MMQMKYNKLGATPLRLSHVSLGGASFSDIYGDYDEDLCVELIKQSLKLGINYLETGPWYGQGSSERIIGRALLDVPRDSYYIASKVGRYEKSATDMFDFSAERTRAGVDSTLQRLGLEYVDIIQVHDLSFAPSKSIILNETLPELERAVRDGKAKYIGIADYDLELMKEIVEESKVPISAVLSYAKSTLLDNRLQHYVKFFKRRGIGVINAAPTGMGLLCNPGPQAWHPASDEVKELCRNAVQYCEEKSVELARIAIWFAYTQPGIDTTVCGFRNVEQMSNAVKLLYNGLSAREHRVLYHLKKRFFNRGPQHWDDVEVTKYRAVMQERETERRAPEDPEEERRAEAGN